MLRINFGMQEVNHFSTGIGVFNNRMILELMEYPDLNCCGNIFYTPGLKRSDLNRFNFPVKIFWLPARFAYNPHFSLLPVTMDSICRRQSEVNLFFSYKLPRVRFRGKVVTTIHDLIPLKTEMENPSIKARYLARVRDAINRSDRILTVSEHSKRDLMACFNLPDHKLFVVPNGVDYAVFNPPVGPEQRNEVRERYQLPHRFILYFGSTRKHKNVASLLQAYTRLPERIRKTYHLVITNADESLKQIASESGMQQYIRFIGRVAASDKVAIYQMADLNLFLSLYEGFGLPVIEAMAAGVPVITSNTSSLPEVAADAAVLVNPLDIDRIAGAIADVLTCNGLRRDLIQRGQLQAQNYSWENAAKRLHDWLINTFPSKSGTAD
jgi:glycosyltransferase involved in cell wall biosynthesis